MSDDLMNVVNVALMNKNPKIKPIGVLTLNSHCYSKLELLSKSSSKTSLRLMNTVEKPKKGDLDVHSGKEMKIAAPNFSNKFDGTLAKIEELEQ